MNSSTTPYFIILRDPLVEPEIPPTPEQKQEVMNRWSKWAGALIANGKLQVGHPLEKGGRTLTNVGGQIVDGPFVESKEAVGGFILLHVADEDEAMAIARECPGLAIGITLEIRPAAEFCPTLRMEAVETRETVGV